jgi:RHS repeat-associated protein
MGRFMNPDPSGLLAQRPEDPQSWNMYAYARNNPLIFIDPRLAICGVSERSWKIRRFG